MINELNLTFDKLPFILSTMDNSRNRYRFLPSLSQKAAHNEFLGRGHGLGLRWKGNGLRA